MGVYILSPSMNQNLNCCNENKLLNSCYIVLGCAAKILSYTAIAVYRRLVYDTYID